MSATPTDQLSPWIQGQLAAGKSAQQISQELIASGWAPSDVSAAVAKATAGSPARPSPRMTIDVSSYPRDGYVTPGGTPASPGDSSNYSRTTSASYASPRNAERRQESMRLLLVGTFSFGVGLAITLITYSLAAHGGIYIIAWGAILYGLIDMVRGLAGLL